MDFSLSRCLFWAREPLTRANTFAFSCTMESLGARSAIAPALARSAKNGKQNKARQNPFRVRASAKDDDAAEKTKSAVSGA